MNDVTVIYYSSNREDPVFEKKITDDLLERIGNKKLVSVTQKPMPYMGKNIMVGDVGTSDYNIYRQIQIACENTDSKWVVTAESDCLYPPTGYFDFVPPDYYDLPSEDFIPDYAYHYRNLYIYYKNSNIYRNKHFSLCGLFADRQYLLSRVYRSIGHTIQWKENVKPRPLFHKFNGWHDFTGNIPIINIKTGKGIRKFTGTTDEATDYLPFFGSAKELEKELFG